VLTYTFSGPTPTARVLPSGEYERPAARLRKAAVTQAGLLDAAGHVPQVDGPLQTATGEGLTVLREGQRINSSSVIAQLAALPASEWPRRITALLSQMGASSRLDCGSSGSWPMPFCRLAVLQRSGFLIILRRSPAPGDCSFQTLPVRFPCGP
jgi:hypothetical protein